MMTNTKPSNWKEILEHFICSEEENKLSQTKPKQSDLEKEKVIFSTFLDYIKEEPSEFPRFYYKNPLFWNELHIAVKSEAKHRFLTNLANEVPDKKKLKEVFYQLKKNCVTLFRIMLLFRLHHAQKLRCFAILAKILVPFTKVNSNFHFL